MALLERITPSMVVAIAALVLASAGTGYAAAKLPKNSVTTKQVVDRSLRATDFAPGQLPAGRPGATGPAGQAGPQGPTGPQGPAGPSEARVAPRTGQLIGVEAVLGSAQGTLVRALDLPAGRWLVRAEGEAENTSKAAATNVSCTLETPGGDGSPATDAFVTVPEQSTPAASRVQLSLERAVTIRTAGAARVVCRKPAATVSVNVRAGISALRVGDWAVAP